MHPIAPYARTAYAQGWAVSGGPLTDRVKAGAVAAVEFAIAHADHPAVIEATLHIGRLEGVWASVMDRRVKLHDTIDARLKAAWRAVWGDVNPDSVIAAIRRHAGLGEVDAWLQALRQWSAGQVERLLHSHASDEDWTAFLGEVRHAVDTARAEGMADAVGLSADELDIAGIDYDIAFNHAYQALADLDDLTTDDEADQWLTDLVSQASKDLGAKLADMAQQGANLDQMRQVFDNLLDGNTRANKAAFDLLTSRALSRGALDLYRSEGVGYVDFITAGDQRVCTDGPNCASVEANSPYPVETAPVPGLHPLCRCVLAATVPLPGDTVNRFLGLGGGPDDVDAGELDDEQKAAVHQRVRDMAKQVGLDKAVTDDLIDRLGGELPRQAGGQAGGKFVPRPTPTVRGALRTARSTDDIAAAFEDEARAITGRDIPADFTGAAPTTAREYAEGLLRGLERFPDATFERALIGEASDFPDPADYAHADIEDNLIRFNPALSGAADRERVIDALHMDEVDRWVVPGSGNAVGIALHEYGHILDQVALGNRVAAKVKAILLDEVMSSGEPTEVLVSRVSRYALQDRRELVAEAFTDVMLNGDNAADLSKRIFGALEDEYRRTAGPGSTTGGTLSRRAGRSFEEQVQAAIRSGVVDTEELSGGGTAEAVSRVRYRNGTDLVHKQFQPMTRLHGTLTVKDQADAEYLASRVGEVMDARVPRVVTMPDNSSMMDLLPGKNAFKTFNTPPAMSSAEIRDLVERAVASDDGQRIGLLDLLIDNHDRNVGNWMIDDDRFFGIDHHQAWQLGDLDRPDLPPIEIQYRPPGLFAAQYYRRDAQGRVFTDNNWSPADMAKMRVRLDALRDVFRELGRDDWWRFASERLDALAHHATGTVDRLA